MRILLVEDDQMIGQAVQDGLRQEGYAVDWVRDGITAQAAMESIDYALLILDLGLPRKDGTQVLGDLRKQHRDIPVIIVTARDAREDRVRGLDLGADDYLVKPFDLEELAARIRAVLRRHVGRAAPILTHGALTLDPATHRVTVSQQAVELTAREFALLHALMERPTTLFTRQMLEEKLYGWDDNVGSNAVEVHIHHLRRKLGQDAIQNLRGQGYRLGEVK
ncbi:MAG: response regulator [Gammaproteobacteria bacterium]